MTKGRLYEALLIDRHGDGILDNIGGSMIKNYLDEAKADLAKQREEAITKMSVNFQIAQHGDVVLLTIYDNWYKKWFGDGK